MNKNKILLLLALFVGLLVRLYHLTAISLWHDEAFSALLINYPWKEMFYRIGLDVHPPVYYVLLRLWSDILGHSLWSLRGFSVFFGVATIYAVYLFMKEAFGNQKLALAAAFLVAINPFQIQYVTEARMYTLGTFLIVMTAYWLVRGFRLQNTEDRIQNTEYRRQKTKIWINWILYAIFAAAAMMTHYYLLFSVFAIGLYGLIYVVKTYGKQFSKWSYFLAGNILAIIFFLPWLKTFLFQFRQVQENYWIPKISAWSIPQTNWTMLIAGQSDPNKSLTRILLVLGVLFSLYVLYRIIRRQENFTKWLVIIGLIVPFIGALALSLKQSIYLDRYFLFAGLFYTMAISVFLFTIKKRTVAIALFLILAVIYVFNWVNYWKGLGVGDKPGMAAAAEYLNNNVAQNDKIFLGSSFEFFNFKYYNQTGQAPLLYTPGIKQVSDLPHFSGTALLDNSDLIHDFNAGVKPGDTAWLLWTNGFGGSKPTVPDNWKQINEKGWQDVRPWPGTWIVVDEYQVQ